MTVVRKRLLKALQEYVWAGRVHEHVSPSAV